MSTISHSEPCLAPLLWMNIAWGSWRQERDSKWCDVWHNMTWYVLRRPLFYNFFSRELYMSQGFYFRSMRFMLHKCWCNSTMWKPGGKYTHIQTHPHTARYYLPLNLLKIRFSYRKCVQVPTIACNSWRSRFIFLLSALSWNSNFFTNLACWSRKLIRSQWKTLKWVNCINKIRFDEHESIKHVLLYLFRPLPRLWNIPTVKFVVFFYPLSIV